MILPMENLKMKALTSFVSTCVLLVCIFNTAEVLAKPKQKNTQVKQDELTYLGQEEDKASHRSVAPDGNKDMHFRMVHRFSKGDELLAVYLNHVTDDAKTVIGWRTDDKVNYLLIAEANGKILTSDFAATLGKLDGIVNLDFYANVPEADRNAIYNTGSKGRTYQIDLLIKDVKGREHKISRQVTI